MGVVVEFYNLIRNQSICVKFIQLKHTFQHRVIKHDNVFDDCYNVVVCSHHDELMGPKW